METTSMFFIVIFALVILSLTGWMISFDDAGAKLSDVLDKFFTKLQMMFL